MTVGYDQIEGNHCVRKNRASWGLGSALHCILMMNTLLSLRMSLVLMLASLVKTRLKTINFEFSRCPLADNRDVKEFYRSACRSCSTIIFPHSTNQIIVFWRCLCLSSRMSKHFTNWKVIFLSDVFVAAVVLAS